MISMPKVLNIKNGPGRWSMMLAVFNSQPITLSIKEKGWEFLDGLEFQIDGGYFYVRFPGRKDNGIFDSTVTVPVDWRNSNRVAVRCRFNLRTHMGKMENPAWVFATHEHVSDDELKLGT